MTVANEALEAALWSARRYEDWRTGFRHAVVAECAVLVRQAKTARGAASGVVRLAIMLGPDDAMELVKLLEAA